MRDEEIIIHGWSYIKSLLTHYVMFWTHNPDENIIDRSLRYFRQRRIILTQNCNVTRPHGNDIVTSYLRIVLARANRCQIDIDQLMYVWQSTFLD